MYKVTNNNQFPYTGRYDGVEYTFPVAQPVYCDDIPANHIFGLGQFDKTAMLARNGWATVSSGVQCGLDILDKFSFERVVPVFDAPLARVDHEPALMVEDAGGEDPSNPPAVGDAAALGASSAPAGAAAAPAVAARKA